MARRNKSVGEKYNSPFAKAIRALMNETNMTQDMLSEKIGRTRQTVSQYVNGVSEPGYETLVKIADTFHVTVDYLLGRTESRTLDTSIQAVTTCTGLTEDNAKFLSDGMVRLRDNCPPAGFEDMFILDPGSQAYYRARGALFILNSWIELMRNDPGMCRRADKLYQFFTTSHTSDSSDSADSRNEWLHLTAHMLSEEEYMRYISNETAKAFDVYLVSKCLSGTPAEQE